jgi:uncharacterized protein YkwD
MLVRQLSCLIIVLLVLPQIASAQATTVDLELNQVESKLVARTNQARANRGLAPLAISGSLMNSARRHTAWMCNNNTMTHTSDRVAENIAMGQHSVDAAIQTWMNSSGHRANMLSSSYSQIGVAAYRANNGTIYWCQQFLR